MVFIETFIESGRYLAYHRNAPCIRRSTMTATQPKTNQTTAGKVYRAKVTGRHAITLPAELCRQLGIEVGDSVELEIKDGIAEIRPAPLVTALPIASLRGILRGMYRDWDDIQQHIRELRDEWDDHPEQDDAAIAERTDR
jgi:AbrB family looped-hinge helix DNA binding protein